MRITCQSDSDIEASSHVIVVNAPPMGLSKAEAESCGIDSDAYIEESLIRVSCQLGQRDRVRSRRRARLSPEEVESLLSFVGRISIAIPTESRVRGRIIDGGQDLIAIDSGNCRIVLDLSYPDDLTFEKWKSVQDLRSAVASLARAKFGGEVGLPDA